MRTVSARKPGLTTLSQGARILRPGDLPPVAAWTEWSVPAFAPAIILTLWLTTNAAALDLHNARVTPDPNLTGPEKKSVQMLLEEVEHRTALNWSTGSGPTIKIHHALGTGPKEGFHLTVHQNTVDIQGNDERGTLRRRPIPPRPPLGPLRSLHRRQPRHHHRT